MSSEFVQDYKLRDLIERLEGTCGELDAALNFEQTLDELRDVAGDAADALEAALTYLLQLREQHPRSRDDAPAPRHEECPCPTCQGEAIQYAEGPEPPFQQILSDLFGKQAGIIEAAARLEEEIESRVQDRLAELRAQLEQTDGANR